MPGGRPAGGRGPPDPRDPPAARPRGGQGAWQGAVTRPRPVATRPRWRATAGPGAVLVCVTSHTHLTSQAAVPGGGVSATALYRPISGDATAHRHRPQEEPPPGTLLPLPAPAGSWLCCIHAPGGRGPRNSPVARPWPGAARPQSRDRTLRGPQAGGGGGRAARDGRPSPGSASSRSAASAEGHGGWPVSVPAGLNRRNQTDCERL